MQQKGWHKRPGVRILAGRWQVILTKAQYTPRTDDGGTLDPIEIGKFDIVYFDTFQEGYPGHFDFIQHVPRLLRGPGSRFSFFNGHAQGSELMYKVHRPAFFSPYEA
jgi:protein arginine N-methyltransferase 2